MRPLKRGNAEKKNPVRNVSEPVINPALKSAMQGFYSAKTEENLQRVVTELKKAEFLILIGKAGVRYSQNPSTQNAIEIQKGSNLNFLKTFDEWETFFTIVYRLE